MTRLPAISDRHRPTGSLPRIADQHALVVGGTRRGKSGLLELLVRATPPDEGYTLIDPHGSCVRAVRDYLANPANGQLGRVVHVLDPASDHIIGLNPLEPHCDTPEGWHDAAVTLSAAIESRFAASPEETPRLARLIYVGGYLCARHGLTVVELLELFTVGGEDLRTSLLQDFDNHVVRRELEDLHLLAVRNVREFITLVESCKNRLVRWLGDRRLLRVLGQSRGLAPRAVMDGANVVLADLSALTYQDAALVGTIMSTMYVAAARRRPPLQGAAHRLVIDEAESLITVDTARGADQVAKNRLYLVLAIQRLGQLLARGDFIADALFVNCGVKICFGGLVPDSARFMAEMLFAGHIDLEEWKPGSARPTVTGLEKVAVRSTTRGSNHVEGRGLGQGSVSSRSDFAAMTDSFMTAWGSVLTAADTTTLVPGPEGAIVGLCDARGRSRTSARSAARARGTQTGEASVVAQSEMAARGGSETASEAETFIPRYETLPTQMYSLEEQLARVTWELMALPRRHCIVRVESEAPVRTRTHDLAPAFKSEAFRSECLPLFLARAAARSPYARPIADIEAELLARGAALTTVPDEPDFSLPEPITHPDVIPLHTRRRPPTPTEDNGP